MNRLLKMKRNIKNSSSILSTGDDYTVTFDDRDIYLTGEITTQGIQLAIETINAINKADNFEARNFAVLNSEYNAPPINIYINSPGGEAMATLGLITTIESSETEIHTHCIGEAASAALLIFSVGHQRFAYKHSIFMYHQLSAGTGGTFKDIEDQVETLKHLQERLEEIFATYTKFKPEELAEIRQSKRDHTFYYQEALDKGLADKVIISSMYAKDVEGLKDNTKISITDSNGEAIKSNSEDTADIELSEDESDVIQFMSYPEAIQALYNNEGVVMSRSKWDLRNCTSLVRAIFLRNNKIALKDFNSIIKFSSPEKEDILATDYYILPDITTESL